MTLLATMVLRVPGSRIEMAIIRGAVSRAYTGYPSDPPGLAMTIHTDLGLRGKDYVLIDPPENTGHRHIRMFVGDYVYGVRLRHNGDTWEVYSDWSSPRGQS